MTTFERIDATLAEMGWAYDWDSEEFRRGRNHKRRLDYQTLLMYLPGITLQDLASYVSHKDHRTNTTLLIFAFVSYFLARLTE